MDPLTVAYVGNFTRPWCTEVHVAGSLRSLGHTVLELQENLLDWATLPQVASAAHLVLWTRTWPADMDVVVPQLDRLREAGIPTVSYHLDRWWGLDREHQVTDQPFFHTDLVVSPDGANDHRWAEAGVNHLFLPPGVYAPECTVVAPNPRAYPHDVVFVGSHPYPHAEWEPHRTELIDTMRAHFGRRFAVHPRVRGKALRGKALQTLYATAKVVVGDSCLAGGATHYWSDRIPETLGRGGLLIHPEVEGLADWYTNHAGMAPGSGTGDLLTHEVDRIDQAVVLADWALANPDEAQAVRDHGRATVLGRDTYAHRMATVIDHVDTTLGLGPGPRGAPVSAPTAPPGPEVRQRPTTASMGRWRARFDPRPGLVDLDESGDFTVVTEVWAHNDYRVPTAGFTGVVMDVGANVGAFTVLAAKAGAARVIAVEPEAANRERLEHHLRLNHVADRVTVVARAVTADGGPVVMAGTGGGARSTEWVEAGDEVVPGVTLEALLVEYGPVELLKIDCEGAEYPMIEATPPEVLARWVERIALEWHGPVMPHLGHLAGDEFGPLVARLADCGRVETCGHPDRGGLLHWRRY